MILYQIVYHRKGEHGLFYFSENNFWITFKVFFILLLILQFMIHDFFYAYAVHVNLYHDFYGCKNDKLCEFSYFCSEHRFWVCYYIQFNVPFKIISLISRRAKW